MATMHFPPLVRPRAGRTERRARAFHPRDRTEPQACQKLRARSDQRGGSAQRPLQIIRVTVLGDGPAQPDTPIQVRVEGAAAKSFSWRSTSRWAKTASSLPWPKAIRRLT